MFNEYVYIRVHSTSVLIACVLKYEPLYHGAHARWCLYRCTIYRKCMCQLGNKTVCISTMYSV